jgi:hypothetical protein
VILRRWAPVVVFVAVPSILILPILFSGKMLYGADVLSVFHYSRIVIADAFRSGRLPVWDPHVMCGFPLLAAVQGAVFYPPTWLCVFMSAGTFWTLSALLHMSLSGFFARLWLRHGLGVGEEAALLGGLVYMMSGYIVGHLYAGHVNYVWAYPWIPALLWRLERYLSAPTLKRGVLLAAVLALLFLAGVPQFVFFAGLLVGARLVHFVLADLEGRWERWRPAAKSVGWLALGLLFCAPQLFPTLELISQMQRGREVDERFLHVYSFDPKELPWLILSSETPSGPVPRSKYSVQSWEICGFVGGGAFLLAAMAFLGKHRQRHLWAGVAVMGLLLAMGPHIPLYKGFVIVVPVAGLFRGPARYLLLFTVGVSALAALGFDALWTREGRGFRWTAGVMALGAAVQLIGFGNGFFQGSGERELPWSQKSAERLRDLAGTDGRFASAGTTHIYVVGKCQAAGLDHLCGYEPMMLRRYAELMNSERHAPIESTIVVLADVAPGPVMDMLGARLWFWSSDAGKFRGNLLAHIGGMELHEKAEALPRAWVVNHAIVQESREERLKQMREGPFNPRKTVILEEYPSEAPPIPMEASAGRAKVVSRAPGEYVLEAENSADAYLVLSEAYYPGWRAEVDGKAAEVLPANHLIQAIRLPPGKHVVRFAYRSRFLGAGFAVALLAALVPLALSWRRRSRASAAASAAPSTAGS